MGSRLTRDEQGRAARALLAQAGNLIEFASEYEDLNGIDREALAEQLTRWLRRLPGDTWDMRLPDPSHLA